MKYEFCKGCKYLIETKDYGFCRLPQFKGKYTENCPKKVIQKSLFDYGDE